MNQVRKDFINEFSIDGQRYFIYSAYSQSFKNENSNLNNLIDSEIVGELRIKNKRYVIVQHENFLDERDVKGQKNPVDILTKRELQIVMLIAEGKVNKQVAAQLHISEWTVSTHLRRIFAKLGVDSRAAMIYRCAKFIEQLKREK